MQQITPEQARTILHELCLPILINEHAVTMKVIAAIPVDKGDYRPDEVSKSAMDLAWHIAATEIRFLDSVVAGAFDTSPRPKPESVRTSADLTSWYEENFQSRAEKVRSMSDEQGAKTIDFRGMVQMPAVMMLNMAIRHTIHHRGQLSVYLRPMGSKVPAMYGESYDSAQARAAQKA